MLTDKRVETKCSGVCEICGKDGELIPAYNRVVKKIMWVHEDDCDEVVADFGFPEYIVDCPHCGCVFGVS